MRLTREERRRNRTNLRGILTVVALILVIGGLLNTVQRCRGEEDIQPTEEETRMAAIREHLDSVFRAWLPRNVEDEIVDVEGLAIIEEESAGCLTRPEYDTLLVEIQQLESLERSSKQEQIRRKFELKNARENLKRLNKQKPKADELSLDLAKTKVSWLEKMQDPSIEPAVVEALQKEIDERQERIKQIQSIAGWSGVTLVTLSDSTKVRFTYIIDETDSLVLVSLLKLDEETRNRAEALVRDIEDNVQKLIDSELSQVNNAE